MQLVIWDKEGLVTDRFDGQVVLWRNYDSDICDNAISIPQLIEENADRLRIRYLSWVYELGEARIWDKRLIDHLKIRPGFSFWWMTLIAEKCNWDKSSHITDVIRLFALEDWAKQHSVAGINLITSKKHLVECLKIWCEANGIEFTWQIKPELLGQGIPGQNSWIKRIYNLLPYTLQSFIWLINYLFKNWSLRGEGIDGWRRSEGQFMFMTYFFNLVPSAVKAGNFESLYWTKLPGLLADKEAKTNWLHLYVKSDFFPTPNSAAELIRKFNDNSSGLQTHVLLSSFLSFSVVLQAIKDWIKLCKAVRGLQTQLASLKEAGKFWPLFSEDWRISMYGSSAISNLLMFGLFESALNQLPKQKKCVYLQEGQGWESGFVWSFKSAGHQELIGFPHAAVSFWDLRYSHDMRSSQKTEICHMPIPDRIACNGKATLEAFTAVGYPDNNLVEVESLRHLYLCDLSTDFKRSARRKEKHLLVFGDYNPIHTHKQLLLLEAALQFLSDKLYITLKPHPACPVDTKRYPQLTVAVDTRSPGELMRECDIVYTGVMTSAAVDAHCAGLHVITFQDGSDLNLSPLRDSSDATFVSTSKKLAELIININTEYKDVRIREDYFTLDANLLLWKKLLFNG